MWWLTRARREEKGAVIVLLVAAVVVIVGMAALVIDVGAILDEKRQLQNGADAAALATAQLIAATCPTGGCITSDLQTRAQGLADANALDGTTRIEPLTPDYSNQRVVVKTSAMERDGGTILPYWFAQAVTGKRGTTVSAAAEASWAGLRTARVVPLTLSKSGFDCVTSNNTVFGEIRVLEFRERATSSCSLTSGEMPGGFGWLRDENDDNSNDCSVTPSVGNTIRTDPGLSGPPGRCNPLTLLNTDVLVPIFDSASGNGGNGTFHIYGFAQFHVTGFRFPSSGTGGVVSCPSNACIAGNFTRFVGIGEYGGPNLGNRVALVK